VELLTSSDEEGTVKAGPSADPPYRRSSRHNAYRSSAQLLAVRSLNYDHHLDTPGDSHPEAESTLWEDNSADSLSVSSSRV
jgi:hypothetical protein